MAKITVKPVVALFDEPLEILITGLDAFQDVTLQSCTISKVELAAIAHYVADGSGEVDAKTSTSIGGSFIGVEPNGLLWAMTPPDGSDGQVDKASLMPIVVRVSVFEGHLTNDATRHARSLCNIDVKRKFIAEGVQRIPVKEGRVCGTLFKPNTAGRMPGIVWINGFEGGIKEQPASMLASRGFITLAVAHSRSDGLPEVLLAADMEYFAEAVFFLQRQKNVSGVGVFGFSIGGTIALAMAGCSIPHLRCVVAFTSPIALLSGPIKYKGAVWNQAELDFSMSHEPNGVLSLLDLAKTPSSSRIEEFMPPFWKKEVPILHILAGDDGFSHSTEVRKTIEAVLPLSRKAPYKIITFPGAGHLIYPPYHPLCRVWYFNFLGKSALVNLGGVAPQHARAQKNAWGALQQFFRRHLSDSPKL